MLDITKEQVKQFREWHYDFLTKVKMLRGAIKTAIPDCADNKIYKQLGESAEEINRLDITEQLVKYRQGNTIEHIDSERKFGFYLSMYLDQISSWVKLSEVESSVYKIFMDKCSELKEIFQI